MRGADECSGELFSYIDLEQRVRADHPLRVIRSLTDAALGSLSRDFAALYSGPGRPSIAPEMLLRAMLLQAFYSVRSERQLMERLEFDLLFRWFVGLGLDDAVWDHSTFSKNRNRLLNGEIAAKFLNAVLTHPRIKRLLSSEHFSVDGTLIEAWASMKSFKPKGPVGGRFSARWPHNARRAQRGDQLQGQEAVEHDPPQRDRSPCLTVPPGGGHGGEAMLHRSWADGEPLQADRRCQAHPRLGACNAGPAFRPPPRSRQLRSIEGAMPSSPAICVNGRPLLASRATASRLNSSVN
jgi:transposase